MRKSDLLASVLWAGIISVCFHVTCPALASPTKTLKETKTQAKQPEEQGFPKSLKNWAPYSLDKLVRRKGPSGQVVYRAWCDARKRIVRLEESSGTMFRIYDDGEGHLLAVRDTKPTTLSGLRPAHPWNFEEGYQGVRAADVSKPQKPGSNLSRRELAWAELTGYFGSRSFANFFSSIRDAGTTPLSQVEPGQEIYVQHKTKPAAAPQSEASGLLSATGLANAGAPASSTSPGGGEAQGPTDTQATAKSSAYLMQNMLPDELAVAKDMALLGPDISKVSADRQSIITNLNLDRESIIVDSPHVITPVRRADSQEDSPTIGGDVGPGVGTITRSWCLDGQLSKFETQAGTVFFAVNEDSEPPSESELKSYERYVLKQNPTIGDSQPRSSE